jgi:molybdopterin molybdotransferase
MNMTDNSTRTQLISVEDAQNTVLNTIKLLPTERVSLQESVGRVLAEEVASDMDISPFDNTAMDGFAVRFEDFEAWNCAQDSGNSPDEQGIDPSSPLRLTVVGRIGAGEVWNEVLQPGEALRIMTGAPLPEGANTVVKIEDTEVLGVSEQRPEGSDVVFTRMPKRGEHVRAKGEEATKGQILLRKGDIINPASVGLMAATGHSEAVVYRRPRVTIFSTGDELVDIDTIPGPGQIRNSNSYSLAAQVIMAGGIPRIMPRAEDTREGLADSVRAALADSDFVITSGGASVGDFDFVAPVVNDLGELFFTRVNMRPGKSQIFGIIDGIPLFGLPGNPGAASVGFEIIIRPALRKMQGFSDLKRVTTMAVADAAIKKNDETRRLYLRARLNQDAKGAYHVLPDKNQSSALLGALNRSNCLLVVPEGDGSINAGEQVKCIRLDISEGTV